MGMYKTCLTEKNGSPRIGCRVCECVINPTFLHLQLAVPGDAKDDNIEPGGAPARTAGDSGCGLPI